MWREDHHPPLLDKQSGLQGEVLAFDHTARWAELGTKMPTQARTSVLEH